MCIRVDNRIHVLQLKSFATVARLKCSQQFYNYKRLVLSIILKACLATCKYNLDIIYKHCRHFASSICQSLQTLPTYFVHPLAVASIFSSKLQHIFIVKFMLQLSKPAFSFLNSNDINIHVCKLMTNRTAILGCILRHLTAEDLAVLQDMNI